MAKKSKQIRVFYAWQSDPQVAFNRSLIRQALRLAINEVEAHASAPGLSIYLDEATRDLPGSPNVPDSIRIKIESSDIVICDITTINKDAPIEFRRVPNPNVTFELGFAAAHLGWDRIVLLFNTASGDLKTDPPFDVDRQRIAQFSITEADAKTKTAKASLASLLTTALQSVIVKDPPRPADLKQLSPTQIKRRRDLENLRWALGAIHWPTLDEKLQEGPRIIRHPLFFFSDGFDAIITNTLFHLYDDRLSKELAELHLQWSIILSFGQHYHETIGGDSVFTNPGDLPLSRIKQRDWDKIEAALRALTKAKFALINDLRKRYLEIDLDDLSATAWKQYVHFEKQIAEP